jgi:hypothetical protein
MASLRRISRFSSRSRTTLLAAAVLVAGVALYAKRVGAAHRADAARAEIAAAVARGAPILRVPHAPGPITLDGDTDDLGWLHPPGPARTGAYHFANGEAARPYSETRMVWSGDYLYFALYASDEDIETHVAEHDGPIAGEDAFRVVLSRAEPPVAYAIEVSPKPVITDAIKRGDGAWDLRWESGAHASREIDGTINDPRYMDEEWGIELAVPFAAIGMRGERGETIGLSLRRCDTPKEGPRVCAGWGDGAGEGGRIVLE